jgi:DNA-binding MarR family transcriptional regulator
VTDPRPRLRVDDDFEDEYPGADPSSAECALNIARTADQFLAELARRLRSEAGISMTAMMVLATIDGLGGRSTPAEIGRHVVVSSASITSLVDTNEKHGYVRRTPDVDDRRRTWVSLTPDGRALVDRLLPGMHRVETEVMAALTLDERLELLRLLGKVQASVARVGEQPPSFAAAPRNRPARLDRDRLADDPAT